MSVPELFRDYVEVGFWSLGSSEDWTELCAEDCIDYSHCEQHKVFAKALYLVLQELTTMSFTLKTFGDSARLRMKSTLYMYRVAVTPFIRRESSSAAHRGDILIVPYLSFSGFFDAEVY